MATDAELLTARIVFRAVLPVIKVLLEDDPKIKAKFDNVNGTVLIAADDEKEDVAAYLEFKDGAFEVVPGRVDNPDITLAFSSVGKMNDMFAGKPVLPKSGPMLANLRRPGLFAKVMGLLITMKMLQPDAQPRDEHQARLKIKMTLYMITTALSQLNKAGDPEMVKWTTKQPERIYQWSCEPEGIAAYLKIKAGKSKAGRGYYTRRKPFVHMKFHGADGALPVLSNSVDFVEAISKGMITVDGPPEYAAGIGNFMVRIASMLS